MAPWLQKKAKAEADRLRGLAETYLEPLPSVSDQPTEQERNDLSAFLFDFNKTWRSTDRRALLEAFPASLAAQHRALVIQQRVLSEKDFFQRYMYRCDEDRILRVMVRENTARVHERVAGKILSGEKRYDTAGEKVPSPDRQQQQQPVSDPVDHQGRGAPSSPPPRPPVKQSSFHAAYRAGTNPPPANNHLPVNGGSAWQDEANSDDGKHGLALTTADRIRTWGKPKPSVAPPFKLAEQQPTPQSYRRMAEPRSSAPVLNIIVQEPASQECASTVTSGSYIQERLKPWSGLASNVPSTLEPPSPMPLYIHRVMSDVTEAEDKKERDMNMDINIDEGCVDDNVLKRPASPVGLGLQDRLKNWNKVVASPARANLNINTSMSIDDAEGMAPLPPTRKSVMRIVGEKTHPNLASSSFDTVSSTRSHQSASANIVAKRAGPATIAALAVRSPARPTSTLAPTPTPTPTPTLVVCPMSPQGAIGTAVQERLMKWGKTSDHTTDKIPSSLPSRNIKQRGTKTNNNDDSIGLVKQRKTQPLTLVELPGQNLDSYKPLRRGSKPQVLVADSSTPLANCRSTAKSAPTSVSLAVCPFTSKITANSKDRRQKSKSKRQKPKSISAADQVNRRREAEETFSQPLPRHGYEDKEEERQVSDFVFDFNRTWRQKSEERRALLINYPTVAKFYQSLVVKSKKVTDRAFFERYYFRCDEARIEHEMRRLQQKQLVRETLGKQATLKYDVAGELVSQAIAEPPAPPPKTEKASAPTTEKKISKPVNPMPSEPALNVEPSHNDSGSLAREPETFISGMSVSERLNRWGSHDSSTINPSSLSVASDRDVVVEKPVANWFRQLSKHEDLIEHAEISEESKKSGASVKQPRTPKFVETPKIWVSKSTGTPEPDPHRQVRMVVLMTDLNARPSQVANQNRAMTILEANKICPVLINATDPDQRDKRNGLFELSGTRGSYPQFFIRDGETETYLGDFEMLESLNENGLLKSMYSFYSEPPEKSPPAPLDTTRLLKPPPRPRISLQPPNSPSGARNVLSRWSGNGNMPPVTAIVSSPPSPLTSTVGKLKIPAFLAGPEGHDESKADVNTRPAESKNDAKLKVSSWQVPMPKDEPMPVVKSDQPSRQSAAKVKIPAFFTGPEQDEKDELKNGVESTSTAESRESKDAPIAANKLSAAKVKIPAFFAGPILDGKDKAIGVVPSESKDLTVKSVQPSRQSAAKVKIPAFFAGPDQDEKGKTTDVVSRESKNLAPKPVVKSVQPSRQSAVKVKIPAFFAGPKLDEKDKAIGVKSTSTAESRESKEESSAANKLSAVKVKIPTFPADPNLNEKDKTKSRNDKDNKKNNTTDTESQETKDLSTPVANSTKLISGSRQLSDAQPPVKSMIRGALVSRYVNALMSSSFGNTSETESVPESVETNAHANTEKTGDKESTPPVKELASSNLNGNECIAVQESVERIIDGDSDDEQPTELEPVGKALTFKELALDGVEETATQGETVDGDSAHDCAIEAIGKESSETEEGSTFDDSLSPYDDFASETRIMEGSEETFDSDSAPARGRSVDEQYSMSAEKAKAATTTTDDDDDDCIAVEKKRDSDYVCVCTVEAVNDEREMFSRSAELMDAEAAVEEEEIAGNEGKTTGFASESVAAKGEIINEQQLHIIDHEASGTEETTEHSNEHDDDVTETAAVVAEDEAVSNLNRATELAFFEFNRDEPVETQYEATIAVEPDGGEECTESNKVEDEGGAEVDVSGSDQLTYRDDSVKIGDSAQLIECNISDKPEVVDGEEDGLEKSMESEIVEEGDINGDGHAAEHNSREGIMGYEENACEEHVDHDIVEQNAGVLPDIANEVVLVVSGEVCDTDNFAKQGSAEGEYIIEEDAGQESDKDEDVVEENAYDEQFADRDLAEKKALIVDGHSAKPFVVEDEQSVERATTLEDDTSIIDSVESYAVDEAVVLDDVCVIVDDRHNSCHGDNGVDVIETVEHGYGDAEELELCEEDAEIIFDEETIDGTLTLGEETVEGTIMIDDGDEEGGHDGETIEELSMTLDEETIEESVTLNGDIEGPLMLDDETVEESVAFDEETVEGPEEKADIGIVETNDIISADDHVDELHLAPEQCGNISITPEIDDVIRLREDEDGLSVSGPSSPSTVLVADDDASTPQRENRAKGGGELVDLADSVKAGDFSSHVIDDNQESALLCHTNTTIPDAAAHFTERESVVVNMSDLESFNEMAVKSLAADVDLGENNPFEVDKAAIFQSLFDGDNDESIDEFDTQLENELIEAGHETALFETDDQPAAEQESPDLEASEQTALDEADRATEDTGSGTNAEQGKGNQNARSFGRLFSRVLFRRSNKSQDAEKDEQADQVTEMPPDPDQTAEPETTDSERPESSSVHAESEQMPESLYTLENDPLPEQALDEEQSSQVEQDQAELSLPSNEADEHREFTVPTVNLNGILGDENDSDVGVNKSGSGLPLSSFPYPLDCENKQMVIDDGAGCADGVSIEPLSQLSSLQSSLNMEEMWAESVKELEIEDNIVQPDAAFQKAGAPSRETQIAKMFSPAGESSRSPYVNFDVSQNERPEGNFDNIPDSVKTIYADTSDESDEEEAGKLENDQPCVQQDESAANARVIGRIGRTTIRALSGTRGSNIVPTSSQEIDKRMKPVPDITPYVDTLSKSKSPPPSRTRPIPESVPDKVQPPNPPSGFRRFKYFGQSSSVPSSPLQSGQPEPIQSTLSTKRLYAPKPEITIEFSSSPSNSSPSRSTRISRLSRFRRHGGGVSESSVQKDNNDDDDEIEFCTNLLDQANSSSDSVDSESNDECSHSSSRKTKNMNNCGESRSKDRRNLRSY